MVWEMGRTTLFNWMRICKNWYKVIALKLGLLRGDIVLNLRNGLRLTLMNRGEHSDTKVLSDIYFNRPYTRDGFDIKKGDVVVDIGANVGIFSTFATSVAENVKVFAYEPSPDNFKYLEKNVVQNNLQKKIKVLNLAVSDRKEKVKLFTHSLGSGGHSIYEKVVVSDDHSYVEVPATTLKEIFVENNLKKIDFLKMDCEGAEYNILFKAPKECLKKISRMAVECHDVGTYNQKHMKDFLLENGFEVKEFSDIIHATGR